MARSSFFCLGLVPYLFGGWPTRRTDLPKPGVPHSTFFWLGGAFQYINENPRPRPKDGLERVARVSLLARDNPQPEGHHNRGPGRGCPGQRTNLNQTWGAPFNLLLVGWGISSSRTRIPRPRPKDGLERGALTKNSARRSLNGSSLQPEQMPKRKLPPPQELSLLE